MSCLALTVVWSHNNTFELVITNYCFCHLLSNKLVNKWSLFLLKFLFELLNLNCFCSTQKKMNISSVVIIYFPLQLWRLYSWYVLFHLGKQSEPIAYLYRQFPFVSFYTLIVRSRMNNVFNHHKCLTFDRVSSYIALFTNRSQAKDA